MGKLLNLLPELSNPFRRDTDLPEEVERRLSKATVTTSNSGKLIVMGIGEPFIYDERTGNRVRWLSMFPELNTIQTDEAVKVFRRAVRGACRENNLRRSGGDWMSQPGSRNNWNRLPWRE